MAYGLHWEWRGFGRLDAAALERMRALAFPAGVQEIVDRYIWLPHSMVNLKVRSWPGGHSLKLKRFIDEDPESGLELWAEYPDDDYELPLAAEAAVAILAELGFPSHFSTPRVDEAELVESIQGTAPEARVVAVRKRRSRAVTRAGATMVQIERADILEPEKITSIGIEDVSDLRSDSPRSVLDQAREAVCEIRDHLVPRWKTCNYLSAVDTWARNALLDAC